MEDEKEMQDIIFDTNHGLKICNKRFTDETASLIMVNNSPETATILLL